MDRFEWGGAVCLPGAADIGRHVQVTAWVKQEPMGQWGNNNVPEEIFADQPCGSMTDCPGQTAARETSWPWSRTCGADAAPASLSCLTQGGTYALMNSWSLLGATVHLDSICPPNLQSMGRRFGVSVCLFFFTSFPLADELQKRRMALVGTLRSNKPELPLQHLNVRHREVLYCVCIHVQQDFCFLCPEERQECLLSWAQVIGSQKSSNLENENLRSSWITTDAKGLWTTETKNNNASKSMFLSIIDLVKAVIISS